MRLSGLGIVLGVVTIAVGPLAATAADLDGSKPLLCSVNTVMECDGSGQCHRHSAGTHPDFPALLRVDVGQRTITGSGGTAPARKTEIKAVSHLDGRLMLHGGENGRAWAATIAENTGHMSAGVVGDEYTFALFGACALP